MLIEFNSEDSRKLKVVKKQFVIFSQDPSGFLNPVEELTSWPTRRVANLPNSPLVSRYLLSKDFSCTIGALFFDY